MGRYRWNRFYVKLICTSMILASGCESTAPVSSRHKHSIDLTASQQNQAYHSIENPLIERFEADCKNWPRDLIENARDTFLETNNIMALLLAGGMSVAMHQNVDAEVAKHLEVHQQLRNFKDEGLNFIGHPTTHFVATGLWYALSADQQDEFNNRRAWTMMNALSLTWVTIGGLKLIRNNETPNGDDLAWPSGHTASSFTAASVLHEFYGPKVGIPAYVAASFVAYRMMDTGNHWASDIVFGATLGWVVGHTVAGKHKKLEIGGFEIVPYITATEESAVGLGLLKRF